jgi:hypothetical protein
MLGAIPVRWHSGTAFDNTWSKSSERRQSNEINDALLAYRDVLVVTFKAVK